MQFSSGQYYTPMDREYHEPPAEEPQIEKPILAVNELGVTVPEKHPVTGGHMIQNVESAIRMGASKMQLIMTTPHTSAMGGGAKMHGKDVRESIRELARANNVQIEGLEMPTSSMTNLSGYDPQGGRYVSEQKRDQDLKEVKDAIKFIADVAGGGGVDIWSQEFARDIYDAKWNTKKEDKWFDAFEAYKAEEQFSMAHVVDRRTGRVHEIQKGQPIFEPVYHTFKKDRIGTMVERADGKGKVEVRAGDWVTEDGRWIDPTKPEQLLLRMPEWNQEKQEFKVAPLEWPEIKRRTEEYNRRFLADKPDKWLDPEEYAINIQLDNQLIARKGQSLYYSQRYDDDVKMLDSLKKSLGQWERIQKEVPEDEWWKLKEEDPVMRYSRYVTLPRMMPTDIIKKEIEDIRHRLKHVHEASAAADAQAMEIMAQKDNMQSLRRYALGNTVKSYAEAGMAALDETMHNKNVEDGRPVHVGPELGWPTAYGGHPDEFIEIIKDSRKTMAKRLHDERGYDMADANRLAKRHIKGCFDTGHMGMWLQNFKKSHPNETEEQRVARFKDWYMDMVKRMQKADVIGSVQAVDSATGAHAHLPAGQGILPVVEAVGYLRENGWDGWVVSEGHEEETFGQGRILLQTWKEFGSQVGESYFAPSAPARWSGVRESYFGHTTPPPYVVGTYSPSEDWVFWSGVPLE
ncbi:sugar phosphate isomerase/epimerase [Candidatus Woesearchaeota archaeon]|nr:sugar phosphate isomerase/epimerase [Candidatus Woesearchaeota archaeon]